MTAAHLPIAPPGTILLEEYITPMGLTQKAVAEATGIPYVRFNEMIKGKRRITAEYSLRLGRYFGQSESFWLHLQADTDLRTAKMRKGALIAREVQPAA
jgi:addiction module HigA family antidote